MKKFRAKGPVGAREPVWTALLYDIQIRVLRVGPRRPRDAIPAGALDYSLGLYCEIDKELKRHRPMARACGHVPSH